MARKFSVLFVAILFIFMIGGVLNASNEGIAVYKKVHKSVGMIVLNFKAEFNGEVQEAGVSGTGWFFDPNKPYLLTNNHVVDMPDLLTVNTIFGPIEIKISEKKYKFIDYEGKEHPCKVVAKCPKLDMAIVKVEIDAWEPLKMGNPKDLQVGETIFALGAPLGLNQTFTQGIVSSLDRHLDGLEEEGKAFIGWIQFDCHINPGNSGGPLLNSFGEVVGINTLSANGEGVSGIYFAVPIDLFQFPWFWTIVDKDEFPELN